MRSYRTINLSHFPTLTLFVEKLFDYIHRFPLSCEREARQDMILPLSNPVPGVDGREMHEIHVPKDTDIIISILSSNRNPDIWGTDSYDWKPERWLNPLPDSVAEAHLPGIYSHLMTFIGGSRACIGFKFSQLEMKVVLAVLLEKFRFAPSGEIVWAMNGITTPYGKGSTVPSLPLKVSLVSE
ncbi:cytochrome P450-like protein [Pluteus cervinus]|uniref:Cytochrome P450-like protein n=1 Tax=Pluteus cervinus TaxID=181527 RepID=A0ACD3BBZ5_9AGAR|nr:cytochrome P450-like protein [Pluteus cervinus]